MQPDFVWFKNRTVGYNHQLYDSSRGVNKPLYSSLNFDEASITNGLTRFDPDGFRVTSAAAVNENEIVCLATGKPMVVRPQAIRMEI